MSKKGFTLVELIGVMVLLAMIILVSFPNVLTGIQKTNSTVDEATKSLLVANAKSYANTLTTTTQTCVDVSTLIQEGYTETPIANVSDDQATVIQTSWSVTFQYDTSKMKYTNFAVQEVGC